MKLSDEDRAAIRRVAELLRDVARKPGGSWATLSVCVDGRALVQSETGSYSSGRTVRADIDQPSPLPSVDDAFQSLAEGEP